MANSAYGTPLVIAEGKTAARMARVSLSAAGEGGRYDEAFIQQLAFDHPNCLPGSGADQAPVAKKRFDDVQSSSSRAEIKEYSLTTSIGSSTRSGTA